MNHLENTYRSQEIASPSESSIQTDSSNSEALTPIVLGILALIVGWFYFGIPLSIAAISFGKKAVGAGSTFVGRLLLIAGWVELILTIWFVFLFPA